MMLRTARLSCPQKHLGYIPPPPTPVARRQVSEKKAKQWCGAKGGIPHFDTSAKARAAISLPFARLAADPCMGVVCCARLVWRAPDARRTCLLSRQCCPVPKVLFWLCPRGWLVQEDLNVDDAFATIARNALKNETEEELYIPGGFCNWHVVCARCGGFQPACGLCTVRRRRAPPMRMAGSTRSFWVNCRFPSATVGQQMDPV